MYWLKIYDIGGKKKHLVLPTELVYIPSVYLVNILRYVRQIIKEIIKEADSNFCLKTSSEEPLEKEKRPERCSLREGKQPSERVRDVFVHTG